VAGAATTGAVIGAVAGGGKGAGIGAGIGGVAGMAIAMLSRGSDVRLENWNVHRDGDSARRDRGCEPYPDGTSQAKAAQ